MQKENKVYFQINLDNDTRDARCVKTDYNKSALI